MELVCQTRQVVITYIIHLLSLQLYMIDMNKLLNVGLIATIASVVADHPPD